MTLYAPAIIWVLGAGIGYLIIQKRNIKIRCSKNSLIAVLGLLSIPIAFLFKREKVSSQELM